MKRLILAAVVLVALSLTVATGIAAVFSDSFTGTPSAPLAHTDGSFLAGWDVQVHERGMVLGYDVPDMDAQHSATCGGPPATHRVTAPHQSVFQCNDHVMTSLNGDAYGVIYLTPPQMVDFTAAPGVIEWEMSTEKMSVRDWWDVTISPFMDSQALPLRSDLSQGVDLQAPNRNSIWIGAENGQGAPNLRVIRNGAGASTTLALGPPLNSGIPGNINQAAVRQKMRLTITSTSARFERLASTGVGALVYFDRTFEAVAWRQGVVQIGHHSYDPFKDGSGVAATWHWDEVRINPSAPFYIGAVTPRAVRVNPGITTTLSANAAAPAGSFLRFSASCAPSLNEGPLASPHTGAVNERIASYLLAVPAGSTSWRLRFGTDAANGGHGCIVKDASIVSQQGVAPTGTATPSPTTTVTATPTPTPTATPTPTPTPPAGSNRIFWDGEARFVAGANVPWFNWGCDFGCGGSGGVSTASVRTAVDQRFAQFRATGMEIVRWWMFEPRNAGGGIPQIRPGASGQLEIDPAVYPDIDAALAIAEARDVYIVFNLFSGVGPDNMPQAWVNDPAMRQQLVNALQPMFTRYANNRRLMAWDIFNEPEWQIWSGQANQPNAVALADLIADRIRSSGPTLVTLGEAMLDGIPMWDDTVSLDFHSPHWYSYMDGGDWCAACRSYASAATQFGTNKPIVIGEWDAPNGSTTLVRWNHWRNSGYAGGWAWSLFPERTADNIQFGYATATQFMASSPNPTPTPTVTPTSTPVPTPTPQTYRCQVRNPNGTYTTVWTKAGGGPCP